MFGLSPLTPAYGRDYKSQKAVLLDFNANKDFVCPNGQYTNKQNLKDMGVKVITIRYWKKRKVMVVNL